MVGHSRKAESSTGRQDRAGEQFGPVDPARDIGGPETVLASLCEIARLDLGFAEIAEQLCLKRIVTGALERKRFDCIVQMTAPSS